MAKMSNKAKRKRALEAAEFITHSTMLIQKFREIFQLYDCSDKKVKKHIIKMLNLYSDVLYRKSNGYKLEKMLDADSCYTDDDKSRSANKDEEDDEEENTLKDFLNKL